MADLIQRICDACNEDEKITVSDQSVPLMVEGRTYRLDLCHDHYLSIWRPIERILPGVVTGGPGGSKKALRQPTDEFICPDCGKTWPAIGGLSRHRNYDHGFAPYSLEEGCPYCKRTHFKDIQRISAHVHYSHREEHIRRMTTERS